MCVEQALDRLRLVAGCVKSRGAPRQVLRSQLVEALEGVEELSQLTQGCACRSAVTVQRAHPGRRSRDGSMPEKVKAGPSLGSGFVKVSSFKAW